MITMTDPDAPNGDDKKYELTNKVYVHWVYIQEQEKKKKIVFVPYAPPSPPNGTHNYIFRLYDITDKLVSKDSVPTKISANDLTELKLSRDELNKSDFRITYNSKLLSFLNLQGCKKIGNDIKYRVTSN